VTGLLSNGKHVALFLAALTSAAVAAPPEKTAEIGGRILDESKKPVPNAIVVAHLSSIDGPVAATESAGAVTDERGRFTITGLGGGAYWLCVDVPQTDFLNPCGWSDPPPLVRVERGKQSANNDVQLERGVMIHIRVEDPQKLVTTPGKEVANFRPVMFAKGKPHWGVWSSSGRNGHDYVLVAPADTDFDLGAQGDELQVDDESGKALDARAPKRMRTAPKAPGAGRLASKPGMGPAPDATDINLTWRATGRKQR
jgi:hypothetical protein